MAMSDDQSGLQSLQVQMQMQPYVSRFVGVGRYVHSRPATLQWLQLGRMPSHLDFRWRHVSHAR